MTAARSWRRGMLAAVAVLLMAGPALGQSPFARRGYGMQQQRYSGVNQRYGLDARSDIVAIGHDIDRDGEIDLIVYSRTNDGDANAYGRLYGLDRPRFGPRMDYRMQGAPRIQR